MTKRRGFWLWLGIILLSLSALLWLVIIGAIAAEPGDVVSALLAAVITIPPIGFGVYCLLRARRLRAAEERNREQIIATRPQTTPPSEERNREQIIATRPQTAPAPWPAVGRRTRRRAPAANVEAWAIIWLILFPVVIAVSFALIIAYHSAWLAIIVLEAGLALYLWLLDVARERRKRRL